MIDFVKPEGCTHCTPYRDATRELVVPLCRCREAAPQPAAPIKPGLTPAADQPAAQAVAPVLVRDVAEVLGVSVAHINSALIVAGCAPRSTNMEISGEELLAVAAAVKAAAPVAPPAVQPLTPLTDEQIDKLLESERMRWSTRSGPPTYEFAAAFARAIERAHGIGTLGGIGDSKGGADA